MPLRVRIYFDFSDIFLGRPKANVSPEKKKQAKEDERIRNGIEGKFGVSKRRKASKSSHG